MNSSYSDTINLEHRHLAARATPLAERFAGVAAPQPGDGDEAIAHARLQRWETVFGNSSDRLNRRLAQQNLNRADCERLLGSVELSPHQELPAWTNDLAAILSRYASTKSNVKPIKSDRAFKADKPMPFEDIFVPFLDHAREMLAFAAGDCIRLLSLKALVQLDRQLLYRLTRLSALALGQEFYLFRRACNPLASLAVRSTVDSPPSDHLYRQFVSELQTGGVHSFFAEYAVLGRLLVTAIRHWVEYAAEFCQRLYDDLPAIREFFSPATDPGPVIALDVALSDPHNCGRSVIVATFATGLKLVYKPTDLAVEQAFYGLVSWFNARGSYPPLRALSVLNRSSHGWIEYVEAASCQDASAIDRYYQRMGMLLCLAHVLNGTDFHCENLIASGEHPVLIDLETLLQAPFESRCAHSLNAADQRAGEILENSVLRTGLLPQWTFGDPGTSFDMTGIGAEEKQAAGYRQPKWKSINSDQMRLVYEHFEVGPELSLPKLGNKFCSADGQAAAILRGYGEMYRLLVASRDELLSACGPLNHFHGIKVRCVLRDTQIYSMILTHLLRPEFLRDGADRSIEIERLAQPFVEELESWNWNLLQAEVAALERLDFPYFSCDSDGVALLSDDRLVADRFFKNSGLDSVTTHINELCDEDLEFQQSLIRASLHARFAKPRSTCDGAQPSRGLLTTQDSSITRAELIAAATNIAKDIRGSAILGADGTATWLSLSFEPTTERMSLQPMSDDLYGGRAGVALFLAALEHVTGGAGFRDLALSAILPLRIALRQSLLPHGGSIALGAATGLGGLVYAIARVGRLLNDDELSNLTMRLIERFTPELIRRDASLDVVGGAAGGILSLLATTDQMNGEALEAAVRCGEHLLAKSALAGDGVRTWRVPWAARPLTGFSHGAAGIAYALLRLGHATGDARFHAAAEEGITYENAVFSEVESNWPDFRDATDGNGLSCMTAWCHGASGIGLARVGGRAHLDNVNIRRDIERALRATLVIPLNCADHLCCGNLGRIDFLLEAGKRLSRPQLIDESRRRASAIVRGAAERGCYRLLADAPGTPANVSLFQGIAGIGYALLRLADPERLPCVLLWE